MASLRDRFFVEGVHALGESVAFAADDARKIATVLRGRTGDRVQVVDSAGSAFAASIDVNGTSVVATLDERIERGARESAVRLTVAQAIPKGQKMDLIVEKATELGARGDRAVALGSRRRRTHRRAQDRALAAAREDRRAAVRTHASFPDVAPIADWDELLATFGSYDRVYLPWELADVQPLRDNLRGRRRRSHRRCSSSGPKAASHRAKSSARIAAGAHADLARHAHPAHRNGRARRSSPRSPTRAANSKRCADNGASRTSPV